MEKSHFIIFVIKQLSDILLVDALVLVLTCIEVNAHDVRIVRGMISCLVFCLKSLGMTSKVVLLIVWLASDVDNGVQARVHVNTVIGIPTALEHGSDNSSTLVCVYKHKHLVVLVSAF